MIVMATFLPAAWAAEAQQETQKIEDVVVTEKTGAPGVIQTPSETTIEKDAVASLHVKNVFKEDCYETSGYPATDMTFGATLRLHF